MVLDKIVDIYKNNRMVNIKLEYLLRNLSILSYYLFIGIIFANMKKSKKIIFISAYP